MRLTPDLSTAAWHKSSYSDGGANNCLEVAGGHPHIVPVRDSKAPDNGVLLFGNGPWTTFIEAVKSE